jgi:hypothetical protein
MDSTLKTLFDLYILSTGRRVFALRQVKPIAQQMKKRALVTLIGRALKHDERTLRLEASWAASGYKSDPQRVKRIGAQVDRTLSAIRDVAIGQARAGEPGSELHETLHEFLGALFPGGVFAIAALPYVEELAAVETLVGQLRGPFERHVEELGVGRLVERLAALAVEYREAQEERPRAEASWADVFAARAKGQTLLLQIVAVIAGTYFDESSAEHTNARAALLEPILDQQEAVRLYLKVRKPVEDVDPATGAAQEVPANSVPEVAAPSGEVPSRA